MKRIPVIRDRAGIVRPSFAVTLPLPRVNYTLAFHWNARAAAWFCDMSLTGAGLLVAGMPLRADTFIYDFWREGFPTGFLLVTDTSRQGLDPGREDLGSRVVVHFIGAEEIEAEL